MATCGGCSVLKCSDPGELFWSTGETMDEFVEWSVCRGHFTALRAGARWATHSDLPHSIRQWIVMGDDLEVRKTEVVEVATISVEYTECGKEMRIGFTTRREKFAVLLDKDQAVELSVVVADLVETTLPPYPATPWSA